MSVHEILPASAVLALAYASNASRDRLRALLMLDARMRAIALARREPVFAQMRLAWWREEVGKLGTSGFAPGDPLLNALVAHPDLREAACAIVEGWEAYIVEDWSHYAAERGGALFSAFCGENDPQPGWARIGEGWALADLVQNIGSVDEGLSRDANERLNGLRNVNRSPKMRPLGVLAYLALRNLERGNAASPPREIIRALRYVLFKA
jgi:15-cis-phytoene synthase